MALSSSQKINSLNIIENNLTSKVTNKLDKKTKVSKSYSTTLTKILDEIDAPKLVDFFSLDVEGYEEQVIKGINFKKYNFKFFLVETKNDKVIKLIESKNYKLVKKMSYHDYLFHFIN